MTAPMLAGASRLCVALALICLCFSGDAFGKAQPRTWATSVVRHKLQVQFSCSLPGPPPNEVCDVDGATRIWVRTNTDGNEIDQVEILTPFPAVNAGARAKRHQKTIVECIRVFFPEWIDAQDWTVAATTRLRRPRGRLKTSVDGVQITAIRITPITRVGIKPKDVDESYQDIVFPRVPDELKDIAQ